MHMLPFEPRRLLLFSSLAFALGAAAGCDGGEPCFDDAKCGVGRRCDGATVGRAGVCVDCDAEETPYDGIDNDCSSRTLDRDLDRDGQNATIATVDPGPDCNDQDAQVFFGASERCGDGIDSDCDGQGIQGSADDPDCDDFAPPTITILRPADGATVRGTVTLELDLRDDRGVSEVIVLEGSRERGRYPLGNVTAGVETVDFDTRQLPEGSVTLNIEAVDVAGRMAQDTLRLEIANEPRIFISEPVEGGAYSGLLPVVAALSDPDGIRPGTIGIEIDGVPIRTPMTSTLAVDLFVETSSFAEGTRTLAVTAVNGLDRSGRSERSFVLDRTGPEVIIAEPEAGATVTGTIDVEVTARDPSGVNLSCLGRTSTTGDLRFSLDTRTLPNGPYVLTATATDGTRVDGGLPGNSGQAEVMITVDNVVTAPTVRFDGPVPDQAVLGPTAIELDVQRGDAQNRVELFLDGVLVAVLSRGPWRTELDFRGDAGPRQLEAVVTDGRGQTGQDAVTVQQVAVPRLRLPRLTPAARGNVADFEVADVDGDGVSDIVTSGNALELVRGARTARGYEHLEQITLHGSSVGAFELVDLDDDGDLDWVGIASGDLAWSFNVNGAFTQPPSTTSLPNRSVDQLDVGDIDEDGDPDLVVAGDFANAGYIYRWVGTGYQFDQTLGGDGEFADVRFAHADSGSSLDVVVGRDRTDTVSVFRNDGSGTFGAGVDTSVVSGASRVALQDVDGDMLPDLVVGNETQVEVRLGRATPGAFQNPVSVPGSAEGGLEVADVDGDGTLEVLVVDERARVLTIWEWNGQRGLVAASSWLVGRSPRGLELADLDGSGSLEPLVASERRVVQLDNDGQGQLRAPVVLRTGYAPSSLAVGPVLGTAPVDIVTYDSAANLVHVLEGDGSLGFVDTATPAAPMARAMNGVAVGQLDGSTTGLDLAFGLSGASGSLTRGFFLAAPPDPQNGWPFRPVYATGDGVVDVAIANLDRTGGAEAVFAVASRTAGDNRIEVTDEFGTLVTSATNGQDAVRLTVGDFSTSPVANPQVAMANALSENITVLSFQNGVYTSTTYNAPRGLRSIAAGPVGPSGPDDLVGVAGSEVFVMKSSPVVGFLPPALTAASGALVEAAVLDTNRDNLRDVVAVSNEELLVLVARTDGSLLAPLFASFASRPERLLLGDVDGDGREDLVTNHPQSRMIVIVPNDDDRF